MQENCDRNVLVVGLKLTPQSRELLTWIVAKLTQPGDHVIGVHVLRSTNDAAFSESELDPSTRQQLDDTFDAMLGIYQGLCTLKQIQLDIKVVTGTSLRDGLVEAAKMENATKLILGTDDRPSIRVRNGLAKHCIKHLSERCSVLVIDHGKIVLKKNGSYLSGHERLSAGIWSSLMRFKHQKAQTIRFAPDKDRVSAGIQSQLLSSSSDGLSFDNCMVENPSYVISSSNQPSPDSPVSVLQSDINEESLHVANSPRKDCSIHLRSYSDGSDNPQQKPSDLYGISGTHGRFSGKMRSNHLNTSICRESDCIIDSDSQPGWPLMHRNMYLENMQSSLLSARRVSVVKWALQLPDRPLGSTILEDQGERKVGSVNSPSFECYQSFDTTPKRVADDQKCYKQVHSLTMEEGKGHIRSFLNDEHSRDSSLDTNNTTEKCFSLESRLELLVKSKSCSFYTYDMLERATSGFSLDNLVGRGGYSKVYQGVLENGQRIAVKCLNERSSDEEHELLTEVEILIILRHRHIVSLLGYYVDSESFCLVYDLANKGNLDDNLHGGLNKPVLEWHHRFRIAVGAAQALEYLHDGCPRPVIHRDVKSSNILLSDDFEAQISDFGLAKWAPTSSSHVTCTDVVGTFGYLAPEYFMFGKVNEKTDVYSFGVVLLELITGKRPIDVSRPKGQENLIIWAKPLLGGGKGQQLIDPKLEQNYDKQQMQRMILAASSCIRDSPKSRPGMRQVLRFICMEHEDSVPFCIRESILKDKEDECAIEDHSGLHHEMEKHLALALLGVDNDSASLSSEGDRTHSIKHLEEYLHNRHSRSSSFE